MAEINHFHEKGNLKKAFFAKIIGKTRYIIYILDK